MTTNRVEELVELLSGKGVEQIIAYLNGLNQRVVFSTSFGKEDQVITHFISKQDAVNIGLFTLDTGRLFEETQEVFQRTVSKYKLTIQTYFPDTIAVQNLITEKGPHSFYDSVENRKECCFIRKIEPLRRALKGADIWITGLRREQSDNRAGMRMVEWDEGNKLIKIHPLFEWTEKEVDDYTDKNHVPVNALHKKGYPSIGCSPCTRAIEPGEDFRAGRWWWESSKKECGLHSH